MADAGPRHPTACARRGRNQAFTTSSGKAAQRRNLSDSEGRTPPRVASQVKPGESGLYLARAAPAASGSASSFAATIRSFSDSPPIACVQSSTSTVS